MGSIWKKLQRRQSMGGDGGEGGEKGFDIEAEVFVKALEGGAGIRFLS